MPDAAQGEAEERTDMRPGDSVSEVVADHAWGREKGSIISKNPTLLLLSISYAYILFFLIWYAVYRKLWDTKRPLHFHEIQRPWR